MKTYPVSELTKILAPTPVAGRATAAAPAPRQDVDEAQDLFSAVLAQSQPETATGLGLDPAAPVALCPEPAALLAQAAGTPAPLDTTVQPGLAKTEQTPTKPMVLMTLQAFLQQQAEPKAEAGPPEIEAPAAKATAEPTPEAQDVSSEPPDAANAAGTGMPLPPQPLAAGSSEPAMPQGPALATIAAAPAAPPAGEAAQDRPAAALAPQDGDLPKLARAMREDRVEAESTRVAPTAAATPSADDAAGPARPAKVKPVAEQAQDLVPAAAPRQSSAVAAAIPAETGASARTPSDATVAASAPSSQAPGPTAAPVAAPVVSQTPGSVPAAAAPAPSATGADRSPLAASPQNRMPAATPDVAPGTAQHPAKAGATAPSRSAATTQATPAEPSRTDSEAAAETSAASGPKLSEPSRPVAAVVTASPAKASPVEGAQRESLTATVSAPARTAAPTVAASSAETRVTAALFANPAPVAEPAHTAEEAPQEAKPSLRASAAAVQQAPATAATADIPAPKEPPPPAADVARPEKPRDAEKAAEKAADAPRSAAPSDKAASPPAGQKPALAEPASPIVPGAAAPSVESSTLFAAAGGLERSGSLSGSDGVLTAAGPNRSAAPHQLAQQLAQAMPEMTDQPVELTLSPEELGKVRMTLHSVEGSITVSVQAERPETLDLMRRNIDSLARDFRDMGYSSISFDFGAQADRRDTPKDQTAKADPGEPAVPTRFQTAATAISAPSRTAAGGLDLRM